MTGRCRPLAARGVSQTLRDVLRTFRQSCEGPPLHHCTSFASWRLRVIPFQLFRPRRISRLAGHVTMAMAMAKPMTSGGEFVETYWIMGGRLTADWSAATEK